MLYCLQTNTETFTGQFKDIGLLKIYIYIPVTGITFSNSQEVKRFYFKNPAIIMIVITVRLILIIILDSEYVWLIF